MFFPLERFADSMNLFVYPYAEEQILKENKTWRGPHGKG